MDAPGDFDHPCQVGRQFVWMNLLVLTSQLACIIHEDSAPGVIIAKQVAPSPEKRGLPRAEGDRVRCDAIMASGVE